MKLLIAIMVVLMATPVFAQVSVEQAGDDLIIRKTYVDEKRVNVEQLLEQKQMLEREREMVLQMHANELSRIDARIAEINSYLGETKKMKMDTRGER